MTPVEAQPSTAPNLMEQLKVDWFLLCEQSRVTKDVDLIFSDLQNRYNQPIRFYHNLTHIKFCLDEFKNVENESKNPCAVKYALWFHDVIYDPKKHNNEEKSAQFFWRTMHSAGFKKGLFHVVNLIMATKPQSTPDGIDSQIMSDVVLSVLGQTPEKFLDYDNKIRQENSWVPEDQFKFNRAQLLESFLSRQRIYTTPYFYEKCERQARENLVTAILRYRG